MVAAILLLNSLGQAHGNGTAAPHLTEIGRLTVQAPESIASRGIDSAYFVAGKNGAKHVIYSCIGRKVVSKTPFDNRRYWLAGTSKDGLPVLSAYERLVVLKPSSQPGNYRDDSFMLWSIKAGKSIGHTLDGQVFVSWLRDSPYVFGDDNDQLICIRQGSERPLGADVSPSGKVAAVVFGPGDLSVCSVPVANNTPHPEAHVAQVKTASGFPIRRADVNGFALIGDHHAVILIGFVNLHPSPSPKHFTDIAYDPAALVKLSLCRVSLETGMLDELGTVRVPSFATSALAVIDSGGTVAVISGRDAVGIYRIGLPPSR